jgi:putative membrane protein
MTSPIAERRVLLTATVIGLVLSGISPRDRLTWFLEAAPVLIGIPFLVATHTRFSLTPLIYRLLVVHAVILMVGAHYTYAEVPLGRWVQDTFSLARNHYDRLGHFAQGFVPAMLARELLLRTSSLQQGRWLFLLVTSVCLAFSACYELLEWGTARTLGQSATAFLGTQGDEWDTQWDMFLALLGSVVAQVCLSSTHDRQLEALHLLRPLQRGRL